MAYGPHEQQRATIQHAKACLKLNSINAAFYVKQASKEKCNEFPFTSKHATIESMTYMAAILLLKAKNISQITSSRVHDRHRKNAAVVTFVQTDTLLR